MRETVNAQRESEDKRRARAKKRVEEIKGFFGHLTAYVIVNLIIIGRHLYHNHSEGEALFQLPMLLTPFFWGIGLAFHYMNTFKVNPFFSKDWEERKLQEFIKEDEEEARKFK